MIASRIFVSLVACLLIFSQAFAQVLVPAHNPTPSSRSAQSASDAGHMAVARQLVKAGALNLALEYLQRNPPRVSSTDTLEAWAEQKWSLLILLQDWETLKSDAHGLPASFGAARYFAIPYEARALIELGELGAARHLLQPFLLDTETPRNIQKKIREQLINLYLKQGDYANAKIEAIRFHDEFKPQEASWFVQRAVIEYLAGDVKGASQLLAPIASIEAKLLQSFFRSIEGEITPQTAQKQINQQIARKRIGTSERKLAYALKAMLSQLSDEAGLISRIEALEHYLVIDEDDIHENIVTFDAGALKQAYMALSEVVLNAALVNPGRESLKFTYAQQAQKAGLNTKARALYADVMQSSVQDELSLAAKNLFVNGLIDADQHTLLTALLGPGKVLGNFSHIDSVASAKILNFALEQGDADLISAIAPFLGEAPEDIDSRHWLLQKARVDIFAGRFDQAKDKIMQWLGEGDTLSGEEVDKVLQPVFDLQAVHQNEFSLELFDRISAQTNSKRHRREILFWKAQSYDDMDKRPIAAEHYLRSAMVEANGFDRWGLSARYHAAFTLMEAGQYADSRQLFEALLSVANDASRRASIKQALQRLWLLEHQLGG